MKSRGTAVRSLVGAFALLLGSSLAHAVIPTAPTNLTATAVSTTQINLSWTDTSNNETSFKIERKTGSGGTYSQIATVSTNVVTFSNTALTAGTTYFYRVRASNSSGNSAYTNEASATTAADTAAPTAPTGLTATAASTSAINLSWTASTDNVGVTGYNVERCQGVACTNFALLQVVAPTPTSFGDTGLSSSTSYSYRIRASDAAGNLSGYSTVASDTTLSGYVDTIPPTAPRNLVATAAGAHLVNLSWGASRDDGDNLESGDTLAGYFVERCQGANCAAFAQITSASGTSFSDIALTETTTYRYRVRAFDLAGNLGTYSNIGSVTTQAPNAPPDTAEPTAPSGLSALGSSSATTNAIYLSWNPSSDNFAVTEYRVERCQGANCTAFAEILAFSGTSLNDVASLAAGTSYSYRVRASDASGNLSQYSNVASASPQPDTTPPSAPTSLTGVAAGPNQINLSWTAASDNVAVSRYQVQSCQGAGCVNFAIANGGIRGGLGQLTPTSYADYPLGAGSSYSYRVRAVDVVGNFGDFSSVVTLSTPSQDTTPPTAPTGLTLTAAGQTQVNLNWTASTDNIAVELYRVERCQGVSCTTFAEVATPSGTSFSDYGLTTATTYSYRARAADAAGNLSGYSTIASVTTLPPADLIAPTAPTGLTASATNSSQINLVWTESTDNVGVASYQVDRCQGAGCTVFVQVGTSTVASFSDTGLNPTTSYSYRVRATDAAANVSANSNVASATTQAPPDVTPPTAPTGLSTAAAGATQVNLAWTASTDNVAVTGYRVERCQGAGCTTFAQIGTPAVTSFGDLGLTAGTSYSYRVRATDAAGNLSAYSNVASVSTASAQVQAYYIQPDHLNTPRLIADSTGTTVWRWDQGEPFGNDVPNNNPSGAGAFEFNLRFPGQYFDRETNLAYNYFRDYDPTIGRYVRSDPVGIRASLNTYAYVASNPLVLADPRGLRPVVGKTSILDILGELAKPCEYAENLRELLNVLQRQSYESYQADITKLDRQRQGFEDACRRMFTSNPCFNFKECLQAVNQGYNDQLRTRNEFYDEYRRQLADPDIFVRLLDAVASICDPALVYGPPSRDIVR